MARLAVGVVIGLGLGIVIAAAVGLHAAQEIPDEDVAAATEAGIDPIDLLGAVYTTGLGPREYLIATGQLAAPPSPVVSSEQIARVRLTYYLQAGLTYGGGHTYPGSTACSWNFRLGTRFVLPDGELIVCNDRGLLGSSGWLDLFRRPDLVHRYGPFATVEVLP